MKINIYKNEIKNGCSSVRKQKTNLDNYKTNTSKIMEGQNIGTDTSTYSSSKKCNSDKCFNKKEENNISCDVFDQTMNFTPLNGDILKDNNTTEQDKNVINFNKSENSNNSDNVLNNKIDIEKDKNIIVNKSDLKDDDNLNTKKMDQIIYKSIQSNYDKEFFAKNNLQEEYQLHYNKLSKEYEFFEDDNPYKNKKCYYGNISNSDKIRGNEQYINNSNSESEINSDYDSNDSNFKKKYYEFNDIDFDQIYKYIYKKNNVSENDKFKFKRDHLYLALLWIREKLSLFNNSQHPAIRQCIQDITSLIAYHKPYKQKLVRMFFSKNRNLLTFNSVNEGILGLCLNVPIYSPLEIIIKHLILCRNLLREKKGNIALQKIHDYN
ncbi:arabinogalactan protein [Plasmodium yoelii yoelii]|uniref:Arabinogalactan protein n=1 Tax=Plasmodium yoelii yoelii TaxID=73239 RepID=Q7RFF5_PLAYO|nr:arabinogalactan protein [Plasmodium yoelii yoelii]